MPNFLKTVFRAFALYSWTGAPPKSVIYLWAVVLLIDMVCLSVVLYLHNNPLSMASCGFWTFYAWCNLYTRWVERQEYLAEAEKACCVDE